MAAETILVVDDERNIRRTLRMVLETEGYSVVEAPSGEAALEQAASVDLVILDVRLPKMDGLEVLRRIRGRAAIQTTPVIMVSGHASVADAVAAVKDGATDFFEKPLDRDRILISVRNALHASRLAQELRNLRAATGTQFEMVGESRAIRNLFEQIEKVAPTKGRVLVTGESGTGKELVARALHRLSPRADAPFIRVNCAAIPAELIESELFGYERGAFTGAQARRKGLFELADTGTLFLDEIGDMSPSAQAKVLRALQSGEIHRVGGDRPVAVDVRLVAATNKDLDAAVADGTFREDLYFRLNVIPLHSPPLRERRSDVPLLTQLFLRDFCEENGVREKSISSAALDALSQREWPGNVRELKNVVERMVILGNDPLTIDDLPPTRNQASAMPQLDWASEVDGGPSLREFREQSERRYILRTLDACGWNISRAAQALQVERTNLHKKMKAYGIRREERKQ